MATKKKTKRSAKDGGGAAADEGARGAAAAKATKKKKAAGKKAPPAPPARAAKKKTATKAPAAKKKKPGLAASLLEKAASALERVTGDGKGRGKKKKKVEAVPAMYGTATAHLIVSPCAEAIETYEKAFGAKKLMTMDAGGLIAHAEIMIGDSVIMMSDEMPPMPGRESLIRKSPKNAGASTGGVMLYVEDVDAWHERALANGFNTSMPPTDMFWGDRYCQVEDPYGHVWAIATHVRDMTPEEMQAEMAKMPPPPSE